jgi:hypothetical protein
MPAALPANDSKRRKKSLPKMLSQRYAQGRIFHLVLLCQV